MSGPEETFFGELVLLDVGTTVGTIPSDIEDATELKKFLEELKNFGDEFNKKTYSALHK